MQVNTFQEKSMKGIRYRNDVTLIVPSYMYKINVECTLAICGNIFTFRDNSESV